MNKKIVIRFMVAMVLFMSFLLCDKGIWNTGTIEAYADTDKTGKWEYEIIDGYIYITEYYGKETVIEIPSVIDGYTVTGIGSHVFEGCKSLESITIPEGVTSLGSSTFERCRSLKSITIPKSVTELDTSVFSECTSLESIVLPDSLTLIGGYAFFGCSSLKNITIPKGVTCISDAAFWGCSSLKSITIPDSVTKIYKNAFCGCSSLESIVVDKNNKVYDSRDNCNAIIETSSKKLLIGCKNTVIPKGLTQIGHSAFRNGSIENITIPKGVTSIESHAFSGCSNLKSITIPKGVTSIESYAFDQCSNLESITIPDSVTEIEEGAFFACSSLKSITIPKGVTKIEDIVFVKCNSLKSIVVDKRNKVYDSRNNCNAIIKTSSKTLITGCKNTVIPKEVKKIEAQAFWGCSGLKSITIPDSVKEIGNYAFKGTDKNFIIYSSDGSYAHKYARENKIKWKDSNSGSVDSFSITISKTTYTYDGKGKKPSVTVDMGGTKLKKGTDYTVEYANNVNVGTAKVIIAGTGKYSGKVTKTFTINPSKVKDLKQNTSYYSNAISLTWEKMPGVDGYKIYRATSENGTYKKVATVKKTTYKNNKLEPAKTYYYKVYAYKSKVKGEFSDAVAAGTKTKKPTLNVVGGKKNATLTWEEVTGADGYEVYMKAGKSGKYKKVKTVKANTTVFTKSKLAKGKKYSFKIRTYRTVSGKKIYSDWSAVKSVKIK